MKITGTSSTINIDFGDRKISLKGELIKGGFVVYIDSIIRWDHPYDYELIDEQTKFKMIHEVTEETKDRDFKIYFE